jgi:hypothetical protein
MVYSRPRTYKANNQKFVKTNNSRNKLARFHFQHDTTKQGTNSDVQGTK